VVDPPEAQEPKKRTRDAKRCGSDIKTRKAVASEATAFTGKMVGRKQIRLEDTNGKTERQTFW